MGRDGRPVHTNSRELAFYRNIAPMLPAGLVPRCYGVVEAAEANPVSLLLEDLSDTHTIAAEHPLPPVAVTCRSILQRWARLHAALWDDQRLAAFTVRPPVETWADVLRRSSDRYQAFIDRHGDLLSAERRQIYEQLLEAGPRSSSGFELAGR